MIKFLSTRCPKCRVLETKLKQKNIEYEECNDVEYMKSRGLDSAPALELDDGTILNFKNSITWVKEQ